MANSEETLKTIKGWALTIVIIVILYHVVGFYYYKTENYACNKCLDRCPTCEGLACNK